MKEGEFIYAKTHAEFLNKAFGTNYKAWMKSAWKYNDEWYVWMVRFNKKDGGWKNTFVSNSCIKQENLNGVKQHDGLPMSLVAKKFKNRITFEIDESGPYRKYVFRGLYVYDDVKSDAYGDQYFNKSSNEFLP